MSASPPLAPKALPPLDLAGLPVPERIARLDAFLADQVARVLALGGDAIDRNRSLMDMGLDSLMAMELRNRVESSLKVRLPVADLLKGPTLKALCTRLLDALPSSAPETATEVWEEGTL
jgi:aryl carrier-like protein